MTEAPNFKDPFPRANAGLWKLWSVIWEILSVDPDLWFDRPSLIRLMCERHGCKKKTLVNLLTSAFQYGAIDVRDGITLPNQRDACIEIRVSHPADADKYHHVP